MDTGRRAVGESENSGVDIGTLVSSVELGRGVPGEWLAERACPLVYGIVGGRLTLGNGAID